MAAQNKPPSTSTSRWGSFLSQAVAGVESRLDNILADEDASKKSTSAPAIQQQPKPQSQMLAPTTTASGVPAVAKASPNVSRSSSNNRTNDRLQARLAKAMAGKATAVVQGGNSPRSSVDNASRPSLERQSTDSKPAENIPETLATESPEKEDTATAPASADEGQATETAEPIAELVSEPDAELAPEPVAKDTPPVDITHDAATAVPEAERASAVAKIEDEPISAVVPEEETAVSIEIDQLKTAHHLEIQEYVERIDSIESKLQYLAKSAAESAKQTANAAVPGSVESKLAGKDERIALLMEEGQKLAASEQKYRTIIKKLRQQLAESEKQGEDLRKSKDKVATEVEVLRTQLNSNVEKEKLQEEARKVAAGLQKQIDGLKKEKATSDEILRKLERDLKSKTEEASKAATLSGNLTTERAKLKAQQESYAALLAEREAIAEKARQESVEWSEKLDRAVERGRTVENELRVETKAMETKLELMRTQAEEATSGSGGEAQVKLLRQIETLQSQYASASSNWQSMESTLLAKLSNAEKERDEMQKRESEMRKKARDSTTRARMLDEELQDVQPALTKAREQLEKVHDELTALKASSKATEDALDLARSDLEREHRTKSRDFTAPQQSEWPEDAIRVNTLDSRPESPVQGNVSRTFSTDLASLAGLPLPLRSRTTPLSGSIPDTDGLPRSRRPSAQPPFRLTAGSPGPSPGLTGVPPAPFSPFQHSTSEFSSSGHPLSPPAVDDPIANGLGISDEPMAVASPSSRQHPVPHDMISMSTVAAGPSVQLVERMSAAVRRLEAEKVAVKEEMARVCSQRDEARTDMVGLMKELEEAKTASARVAELEAQVEMLDARYQTTLEMLGEKSELVEELRSDVQDVKAMYRELIEQTMK